MFLKTHKLWRKVENTTFWLMVIAKEGNQSVIIFHVSHDAFRALNKQGISSSNSLFTTGNSAPTWIQACLASSFMNRRMHPLVYEGKQKNNLLIHVHVYQNIKYRHKIIIYMAAVTEEFSAIYSFSPILYPTQITFASGINIWHHHCVTCRWSWYDTWIGHAYSLQFYLLYHIADRVPYTTNVGR